MIKFAVLGSGSKGNAIYVNCDDHQFLVDCGFTKKETIKRLALIGKSISDISRVFITHDHGDHLAAWVKKEEIYLPVLGTCGNNPGFYHADTLNGSCEIRSFDLSHDSGTGSKGYTVQDGSGNKICIIMDTGCIPEEIVPHMFDCAAILIETNYSIEMLIESPYPTELQERIASPVGHLRDQCAAEAVEVVAWPGLKYVVGLHLSSNCINDVLARFELETAVQGVPGCEVVISRQKDVSKMMVVM